MLAGNLLLGVKIVGDTVSTLDICIKYSDVCHKC